MSVLNFNKTNGTTTSKFQLDAAAAGVQLKNLAGNLNVRDALDAADATVTAAEFLASGDTGLVINSNSAGTGADWKVSLARPTTGMTADWTLTLPPNAGSPNQVLLTNGSGVTTWVDAASGATDITDTTSFAFGSAATVAMFTLPANAIILSMAVIVDTAFDGTPTASVGIAGNASKYMGAGDMNLAIAAGWNVWPNLPSVGTSEALEIAFSSGSATVGAARVVVNYSIAA
jgi:hypothetical protein